MSFTIEELGRQLLQEALKTSSFGSKEKDLEKSYKTKYLIESWKYGNDLKSIRNCCINVRSKYLKKVREMESVKESIKNAAIQEEEAAITAKFGVKKEQPSLNDYYNGLETKLYNMKRCKKRKANKNSINSFKKKRKYNLTVRTDFKDWSDFTNYLKDEKEKMKEKKTRDKQANINKKHFKDWNEFTRHLKTIRR